MTSKKQKLPKPSPLNRILNEQLRGTELIFLSREINNPDTVLKRIQTQSHKLRKLIYIVIENEYWELDRYKNIYVGKTDFIKNVLSQYTSCCNVYRQYNMAKLEETVNSHIGELPERTFRLLATALSDTNDPQVAISVYGKIKRHCQKFGVTATESVVNMFVNKYYEGFEVKHKKEVEAEEVQNLDTRHRDDSIQSGISRKSSRDKTDRPDTSNKARDRDLDRAEKSTSEKSRLLSDKSPGYDKGAGGVSAIKTILVGLNERQIVLVIKAAKKLLSEKQKEK